MRYGDGSGETNQAGISHEPDSETARGAGGGVKARFGTATFPMRRKRSLHRRPVRVPVAGLLGVVLVFGLLTGAPVGAASAASELVEGTSEGDAQCADPDHTGGDWPSLNHDLHNTRHQAQEDVIGVEEASSLTPAWTFPVPEEAGGDGGIRSTPIVANGCVYFTVSGETVSGIEDNTVDSVDWTGGTVFALNADTGELVWKTDVNGYVLGLAAFDDVIYALPFGAPEPDDPSDFPEPQGAHAVALDYRSGEMVWASERLDDDDPQNGRVIMASPVVFTPSTPGGRPTLFVPMSGGGGDGSRVPLYFVDARTGNVVEKFFALSEEDYAAGYSGAGIWTTAAFDETTNHLYAGTADSEGHTQQHPRNNAILKIDADPRRRSFASVVDAYSGTTEHYDLDQTVPEWENNVVCESDSNAVPNIDASQSTACLELDLDFGSSPNLYVDSGGRTMVAAMQKSGVLHALEAAGLDPAWTKVMSPPTEAANGATGATDGTDLFVPTFPDLVSSFERTSGAVNWVSITGASVLSYQPISVANGVVYAITDAGTLVAFDAETGQMLLQRPIFVDAGADSCFGTGAGVAIARNTVYAPCDAGAFILPGAPGTLVAYRPNSLLNGVG